MNKTVSSQKGSAEVVLVVVLALALLGSLGFIYWQNFSGQAENSDETQTSRTEPQDVEKADASSKTYSGQAFSIDYPADAEAQAENYENMKEVLVISRHSSMGSETVDIGEISVAVYDKDYNDAGSGWPPALNLIPVDEWYSQQGTEYAASASGAPGSHHGGYKYKLTRERGQMNSAVYYILQGDRLFKIMLQKNDNVLLTDVDESGDASYNLSNEVEKILASFRVL